MFDSIPSPRGPTLYGINFLTIVCIFSSICVHVSSVNMFNSRINKYLVRAGYNYNNICGLSISQWLSCPLPSRMFLGLQSC